ncbi:MAG TPA: hypothetical protein PK082_06150 [Phycisphaerae bacterium]|nr:hypothetical protein [Phycisphaerae bacterium]
MEVYQLDQISDAWAPPTREIIEEQRQKQLDALRNVRQRLEQTLCQARILSVRTRIVA